MKINGYSMDNLNATFVSFLDSPPGVINHFYANEMNIIGYGRSITPKQKTLKLVFVSEKDMSFFVSLILDQVNIELEQYIYDGFASEKNSLTYKHIGGDIYEMSVNLVVVKKSLLMRKSLIAGSNLVSVIGTYKCPCRYIVKALENGAANIGGHQLNNLVKGKVYVLDGVAKTVLCDDANVMNNVKLKNGKFPCLQLGINDIPVSGLVEVILEYNPIWL